MKWSIMPFPEILIVDDTPLNLDVLSSLLSSFHPRIAADGATALRMAQQRPPDLILLDVMMPGLDGFEVCRRIKAREETRGTTVIAITAHPSPKAEQRILECGAEVCLTKPLEAEVLLKHLATATPRLPGAW